MVGAMQSRWVRDQTGRQPFPNAGRVLPWAGRAPGRGRRGRRWLEWLGGPSPGLLVRDEAGVSVRPGPLAGGREAQRPVGAAAPGAFPAQGAGKAGGGGRALSAACLFCSCCHGNRWRFGRREEGEGFVLGCSGFGDHPWVLQGWGGSSGRWAEQTPQPWPPEWPDCPQGAKVNPLGSSFPWSSSLTPAHSRALSHPPLPLFSLLLGSWARAPLDIPEPGSVGRVGGRCS